MSAKAVVGTASRQTLKKPTSRKTYLMDVYTHILRTNAVVLVLHNSTLLKNEDKQLRQDLKKLGATLNITRSNIFQATLRGLKHEDPASRDAFKQYKNIQHPLAPLFNGPSAVITMPELDPAAIDKVVGVVERLNNRLILLGGMVNSDAVSYEGIEKLRKMPTLPELHAQLAGVLTVLGGAGLVQTLESSSKVLYLTLDQHKKNQNGELDQ